MFDGGRLRTFKVYLLSFKVSKKRFPLGGTVFHVCFCTTWVKNAIYAKYPSVCVCVFVYVSAVLAPPNSWPISNCFHLAAEIRGCLYKIPPPSTRQTQMQSTGVGINARIPIFEN